MCGLFELRLELIFSVLYAVPVMSEISTKVSQNFFGDADKTRLVSGIRMCYVYSYFFVNMAQIRMDVNRVIATRKDLFGDRKSFMV
jgi:hypothetical protein